MRRTVLLALMCVVSAVLPGCESGKASEQVKEQRPFAPDLEEFVTDFEGHGEGVDGAGDERPYSPEESIKHFQVADGLEINVVASEPVIRQPLDLHFDERGRLWVVQYLQYPFPAGVKILRYDRYLRAVFDKVPPPPPNHHRGADKITILEDTNGDGRFDSHKDFVSGLNIATSVAVGRGGVWVLNPPYLLFYPDRNRDDVPDGDPEVHLRGFGLEDTHAVANSLHWGPDGWLYGAQGSTTTAEIKGVHFLGQAIWRYHPETHQFELFAEGGGNTWSVEFDRKGRLFSGTNHGATRGLHYAQGGYYVKNFSKHGPLTNPFAFGYLPHMTHSGYEPRFAQTFVIQEGGALPGYEGQILAGMAMTNRVQASKLLPDASTFKTLDTDTIVSTDNRWFRPVDIKVGPDGAVYIADWHDLRLSHLSPRDSWYRSAGRIYRLQAKDAKPLPSLDLAKRSNQELIALLAHSNKWFREQARRVIADRRDPATIAQLKRLVADADAQLALEALWAVNLSGGFDDAFAVRQLRHSDPYVRYWTVRLLGDARRVSPEVQQQLVRMARTEPMAEVRSQLASTCKRLPAGQAFPILRELVLRSEDLHDDHIPMLLWWAIEDKASSDRGRLLEMLDDSSLWQAPIFTTYIAPRLGRRLTAERGEPYYTFSDDYQGEYSSWKTKHDREMTTRNLVSCAQLLELAPGREAMDLLVQGMEEGLEGETIEAVPPALEQTLAELLAVPHRSAALISLTLRLGNKQMAAEGLRFLEDSRTPDTERKRLIAVLADARVTAAVPVFLRLLGASAFAGAQIELLRALQRFDGPEIPKTVLRLYSRMEPAVRSVAQELLLSRQTWARLLLESVDQGQITAREIPKARLSAIETSNDPRIGELMRKHWPDPEGTKGVSAGLKAAMTKGEANYRQACGYCHLASGEGMRASLVSSKWVLGEDRMLARIVLNGKKGTDMEMPPLREQLDNEQIASILSYIRQEWGNQAKRIDAETVAMIRKETEDRKTPWTEEELGKALK
ncbi:MAG: dehydrogenase [Luteitalea sp.]|nr:dehydrogenase [Luteitalea sp.]